MHHANLEAVFTLNRIACLFTLIEHRAFVFGRELWFGSVNPNLNSWIFTSVLMGSCIPLFYVFTFAVAPKLPTLWVNRNPVQNDFRARPKSIRYSVNIAFKKKQLNEQVFRA